jgi:hypothetical protein
MGRSREELLHWLSAEMPLLRARIAATHARVTRAREQAPIAPPTNSGDGTERAANA